MTKEEALGVLDEIGDNLDTCCAITMEPDLVIALLDQIRTYIIKN